MTDSNQGERSTVGVVEELARDDVQRKHFLKMAGKGMGSAAAATGLAAFIAACGGSSSTSSSAAGSSSSAAMGGTSSTAAAVASTTAPTGDLAIVNYALTLEYLESQFYAKVIASGLFHGKNLSVIKSFGAEETQHVVALKKVAMSMGTPAQEPMGKFPIHSATQVTKLAGAVENLGAAAYLGQAGNIESKEILAAALSIHTIEARHAATINLVLMKSPTPDGAFAKPMTMAEVLKVVTPFIA
ncbi:MAG TPA: ferritin-like domain-containing protein [Solirubrobacteraceae bacterium]|nr:ferritin-like domain-containing protein [Solirubrobacteraceae bacterium]